MMINITPAPCRCAHSYPTCGQQRAQLLQRRLPLRRRELPPLGQRRRHRPHPLHQHVRPQRGQGLGAAAATAAAGQLRQQPAAAQCSIALPTGLLLDLRTQSFGARVA